MHREYRPPVLDERVSGERPADRDRLLFGFTVLLGCLIAADLIGGVFGIPPFRPFGISLVWLAGALGAAQVVHQALGALWQGRIGADFALAQAALAALVLREPFVAAEVVFIALCGELIEAWTFARAEKAIAGLVERSPLQARVRRDGVERTIPARDVRVGERVLIGAGERVPVDGRVVAGRSTVDQQALTGESIPVDKGPGEPVFSGTLNQYGVIEVDAERVGAATTLEQVARLTRSALSKKGSWERTADRLARWFLPFVEVAAGLTLVAGLILGWPDVWSRTTAVLVVACPCALVLATPAAMLASLAWLARHGVVVKGGRALERLAGCDVFAFDKTGTLTRGTPEVAFARGVGGRDDNEILRLAAAIERSSGHPLSRSVVDEAESRGLAPYHQVEAETLPGRGVRGRIQLDDGRLVDARVGSRRWFAEEGIAIDGELADALDALDQQGQTALLIAEDGVAVGVLGVADTVRGEAHDVIHELRHLGIGEIAILTGDRAAAAAVVARKVHAQVVAAELLPADKARWIEERQASGKRVAMVGDGLNDAPALARADVGIALLAAGVDLAAEAGDMVLMGDPLRVLPDLVELSRRTVATIRQNVVVFAIGLNAVAILMSALGVLSPVAAALLHQAGSLLVMLSALRLLFFGDWRELAPFRWLSTVRSRVDDFDAAIDLARAGRWIIERGRLLTGLAGLGFGLMIVSGGIHAVGPQSRGVVTRLGRFAGVMEPGLHLRFPPPIERVTLVATDPVRGLELSFRDNAATGARALLVTGDGRYLELDAVLQYSIDASSESALRRHVFEIEATPAALRSVAESAVREVVGRSALLELMTTDRAAAEARSARLIADRLGSLGSGVLVRGLWFEDVRPPIEVLDAYRDVSRAESDRERRRSEAELYRDRETTLAGGRAGAITQRAMAGRARTVALAQSQADAFLALLAARRPHPELTEVERYWATLASLLRDRPKVVLDDSLGRRRHLLFPGVALERALPVIAADPLKRAP